MVKLPSTGERRNGNASQKHPIDDSYQQRYSKQKFQYLVTSLSGNAVKVVESIELTENYEVAWKLLKKYNDLRRPLRSISSVLLRCRK